MVRTFLTAVPELAPSAAVSPGYVVPPHPPPAAPARCSFQPPADGFGHSGSTSDVSLPAVTPTQQIVCLKCHNRKHVVYSTSEYFNCLLDFIMYIRNNLQVFGLPAKL